MIEVIEIPCERSDCSTEYSIYKDKKHISSCESLGTLGEFCGAFFHVPDGCLHEGSCKISAQDSKWSAPRTVVAVVKCENNVGKILYEAKYTNCYKRKMHAEDFFKEDIENNKKLREDLGNGTIKKVTMYITYQPCNKSVKGTQGTRDDHSCCDTLIVLLKPYLEKGVKICIKPTHMYYGNPHSNATQGVEKLFQKGINISRMDEEDWVYLSSKVNKIYIAENKEKLEKNLMKRELDEEIDDKLYRIKVRLVPKLLDHSQCNKLFQEHCTEVKNGTCLFENRSQLCAFFHVFPDTHNSQMSCIAESGDCQGNNLGKPMVVVAEFEDFCGEVMCRSIYTDCETLQVNAEDCFYNDYIYEKHRDTRRVTVYTTWFPRPKFWKWLKKYRNQYHRGLCIKPTHFDENSLKPDVAEIVAYLIDRGIQVTMMSGHDWNNLKSMLSEDFLPDFTRKPNSHHPFFEHRQSRRRSDIKIGISLLNMELEQLE